MTKTRTCPTGSFAYTIKSGDTLYSLAIRYNTTVEAIMALNPGIDPNNLRIGQIICIPSSTPSRCPSGSFQYTIKSGDTLYNLAIKYNTTVEAIMALNPGIDPNNLQIGQVICIPGSVVPPTPTCPSGSFAYTIKSGDTLYKLAITYNTTVEAIMALNPGINPNNLQIGQVICIPRSTTPIPPCDGVYYSVKAGDTLFSIAMAFNIPLSTLIAANPGIDPNNLQIGQLICIPKVVPPPISCPGGTVYTVRENDNLGTILLRFNLSYEDLKAANPNVDLSMLRPGMQLCIMPHEERGCPCPTGSRSYTITQADIPSSGATVVALAQKFNISVSELLKMNPTLAPGDFVVGRVICVPSYKMDYYPSA